MAMEGETPRFWVAFGILLAALALCVVMLVTLTIKAHAEPVPAPSVVYITDDPGGSVGEYYRKYAALSAAGTEIHFHGMCASSCTMVLFTSFTGIRACADEGAIFAFHKPFEEHDGKVVRTKAAVRETRKLWALWLKELSTPLQSYLTKVRVPSATEGDETNTLLLIPGSALLPRCANTVASN
jgi:hypothetical protein